MLGRGKTRLWAVVALAVVALAGPARGAEESASLVQMQRGLDSLWVVLAAVLVFFMQAGFGMVEAGFIRAKNACNILTKNFLDYCTASVMFFLVGYALMFGEGNGFIGHSGFCLSGVGLVVRNEAIG